jgi:hypothetical protein
MSEKINIMNLSKSIEEISNKDIKEIASIIEKELKEVASEYNITADRLFLISHKTNDNSMEYEIGIKIHSFIIKNEFVIIGESDE